MQQILMAIWLQDFDSLQIINPIDLLLLLLGTVLLLEFSLVFLPLPGVGLALFIGGLVSVGAVDHYSAILLLSTAASIGTILAYLQGRCLYGTKLMHNIVHRLPENALPRLTRMLDKYGFCVLFISRYIPFVRVLTPMLMGATLFDFIRAVLISITSSLIWAMSLVIIGTQAMKLPFMAIYQELITKWFLIFSFLGLMIALITLFIHWIKQQFLKIDKV